MIQNLFSLQYAQHLDHQDSLKSFRDKFKLPKKNGVEQKYFLGNSLGLQSKTIGKYLDTFMEEWANQAIQGHQSGPRPWAYYHLMLAQKPAKLVGAKPKQVTLMNGLSVNLNLLLISFYQPKGKRTKIMLEQAAFPSDHYSIQSQIRLHGLNPDDHMILLKPRAGEETLRNQDILEQIQRAGEELATIIIGGINYYTGQFFNLQSITKKGHDVGAYVGFDLAHAVGNVQLRLHDWGIDFACWCTYKYLNSGPGSIAGIFVHEKNYNNQDLPRLNGWFGNRTDTKFLMKSKFEPEQGAVSWMNSNPSIMLLAVHHASLEIFQQAGMENLRKKSVKLTSYLYKLLKTIPQLTIITPQNPEERGCQLSLIQPQNGRDLFNYLSTKNIISDWREPKVIRVAPVPLYNSFQDCFVLYEHIKQFYSKK